MNHLNTNFDPDSFLNLDSDFTPASATPDVKPVPMLTPQSSHPNTAFPSNSNTQSFPGPSFQYDAYHQQTGIPIGALASTFNINRASGLHYNEANGGFVMPTETLNMPLSNLDDFDFARNSSDMDFESDSPNDLPTMFFPDQSSGSAQFISPNTLVGPNNTGSTPFQRIYPGMHSQQAAQAKAQQAQKQEQMARREQQRPAGQKPLPGASPTKTQPAKKDPLVEESISKVLSRMRQASVASSAQDESTPTGTSNMPRIKKDEDDMDEDERLLASEEGKKLSSKERRQLRNKVSARAFRSRRKEYIGQLEGEVAVKVQEANDLRTQNQQLREENNRLTDLTRMLLSSQAFSGFLQELSQSGLPASSVQNISQQMKHAPSQTQAQTQSQSQPQQKDVVAHDGAHQMHVQQPQIGMALIPETHMDFSTFQPSNAWMTALPTNDFQVYSVMEMPEAPTLDLEVLSGKNKSTPVISQPSKDIPQLSESACQIVSEAEKPERVQVDDSVELDEAAFALYFDSASSATEAPLISASAVGEEPAAEEDNLARLERMCSDLDAACDRLADFTRYMA
jgi:ribonuclease Z